MDGGLGKSPVATNSPPGRGLVRRGRRYNRRRDRPATSGSVRRGAATIGFEDRSKRQHCQYSDQRIGDGLNDAVADGATLLSASLVSGA